MTKEDMKKSKKNMSSSDNDDTNRKHCLQITFPQRFSIKKELGFIDYIADALSIYFYKDVYAVCPDVETAVALAEKSYINKVPYALIHSVSRLGPAYCAYKIRGEDPTVLTVRRLAPCTTYHCLAVRFPDAVDICIKRTMAKLKFATREECREAYKNFREVVWPGDQRPVAKELKPDSSFQQWRPSYGQHGQFAEDPKVVYVRLKQNFCLKKHMSLLDHLNTASDIFLSDQCKVIFDDAKEMAKRREVLREVSVMGGQLNLVAYFNNPKKDDRNNSQKDDRNNSQKDDRNNPKKDDRNNPKKDDRKRPREEEPQRPASDEPTENENKKKEKTDEKTKKKKKKKIRVEETAS